MKKIFLFALMALTLVNSTTAQKAKPMNAVAMPVSLKNEDGTTGTYLIKKGDQLVYHVTANGNEYDFIVTVNAGGIGKATDFNYTMTNSRATAGHVIISADARDKAKKYVNYFSGGDMNLTDASTVWVTNANYKDLDYGSTTMSFDGGEAETLYAKGNNAVYPTVKIKGIDKKLNAFSINNAATGDGDKTLWINNSGLNPLIVKMDLGFTIELKEIR